MTKVQDSDVESTGDSLGQSSLWSSESENTKSKLVYLETHQEPSEEEMDNLEPLVCGKIGVRASRFSVYGQGKLIIESLKAANPQIKSETEDIIEVDESSISHSAMSKSEDLFFRASTLSNSIYKFDNYNSVSKDSKKITDSGIQGQDLGVSKYQEKLLNKALQSSSKFSLDSSALNPDSRNNSITISAFKVNKKIDSRKSLDNPKNSPKQKISEMNPKIKPVAGNDQECPGNKISEVEIQANKMENRKDPNAFMKKSKQKIEEITYRDSCDNTVDVNKSIIKFYEHWKLTTKKENQKGVPPGKTQFDSKTIKSNLKERLSSLISTNKSEESNDFDIFNAKFDSSLADSTLQSIHNSRNKRRNPSVKSGLSRQVKMRDLDQVPTKRKDLVFGQFVIEDRTPEKEMNNLLSETITITNSRKLSEDQTQLSDRESMFGGPLSLLSDIHKQQQYISRMSESGLNLSGRGIPVDQSIRKKYSMISSKMRASQSKEFGEQTPKYSLMRSFSNKNRDLLDSNSTKTDFGDTEVDSNMLLNSQKSRDLENGKDDSKRSSHGLSLPSPVKKKTLGSLLIIKKKDGAMANLKSRYSKELKTKSNVSSGSISELKIPEIKDNERFIFDISKEASEHTEDILSKSLLFLDNSLLLILEMIRLPKIWTRLS